MRRQPLDLSAIRHVLALMLIALQGRDPESAGDHLAELARLFGRAR